MKNLKPLFLALSIVVAAVGVAQAGCTFSPFTFFPDRNDRVNISVESDSQSFCDNSFREGPGYRFTEVSVTNGPRHGIIAAIGEHHFAYHAFAKYRGADEYVIRACAIIGARRGCSTLIYEVTNR